METDLVYLKSVDSTNEEVKRRAEKGAKEGLVIMASSQLRGQGRSGRSFYSPDCGNLYMSILLKPRSVSVFEKITVMAAVSCTKAINEMFFSDKDNSSEKALIKWVNDVYYGNRKIAGIIAKAENFGKENQYVILGIGVNIFDCEVVPDEIKDIYGSIKRVKNNDGKNIAYELGCKILEYFADIYETPDKSDFMREYRDLSLLIGRSVVYVSGNDEISVSVVDIDNEGSLVVKDESGRINSYRDGEIRIKIK